MVFCVFKYSSYLRILNWNFETGNFSCIDTKGGVGGLLLLEVESNDFIVEDLFNPALNQSKLGLFIFDEGNHHGGKHIE